MSTAFQAVGKAKRVCFGIRPYKLISSNGITINFQLRAGKGCSIMAMRKVICQHQKKPLFTN